LNTLLQGAGAVVMKEALTILNAKLLYIPHRFVANVHDEWQIETPAHYADTVGRMGVRAIRLAGETLSLRCPLDGEYRVGNNWAETH
jgi:DNA polymerase I-like protein with 3'-5' exonuclease and polymerase domains